MRDFSPEEEREFLLDSAKKETANLKAMKIILEADDDPVMQLTVNSKLQHGFSSSAKEAVLKMIDAEIEEIQKAVDEKPNTWE
jgi:hypothetical protein